MRDLGYRILVVTDEREKIEGVVWRENLLAIGSSKTNLLVNDIVQEPLLIASLGEPLKNLLRKMLDLDTWYVAVANNPQDLLYQGVFGFEHFLEFVLRDPEMSSVLESIKVNEVMTTNPIAVKPGMFVTTLWRNMIKYRFAGFPVVDDNNRVVGFVSQHDLLKISIPLQSERSPRRSYRISTLMTRPAIVVREEDNLLNATKTIVFSNIGRLPVVSSDKSLIGIIDRSDIIKTLISYI